MPITKVTKTVEIEFDAIRVVADVRYGDEDMPNDAPFRKGDTWDVVIDLKDDGKAFIRNWPAGHKLDLHMKVCDCGIYAVLNGRKEVGRRDQDYVPSCFPGDHYGDYLILDIREDGLIANWKKNPNWTGLIPGDE